MKTVVSDLDNTLVFIEKAIQESSEKELGEKLSYKQVKRLDKEVKRRVYCTAFSEYKDLLIPNQELIRKFEEWGSKGYEIVIVSAREQSMLHHTKKTLENANIPFDRLILREDLSLSDEEWKNKVVNELAAEENEILFFEDKLENINHIRKENNKLIKYYLVAENSVREIND